MLQHRDYILSDFRVGDQVRLSQVIYPDAWKQADETGIVSKINRATISVRCRLSTYDVAPADVHKILAIAGEVV